MKDVDTKSVMEWLGDMASFAFQDLMNALDRGNLEEAKAHAERIKILECTAPWVGADKTTIYLNFKYVDRETGKDYMAKF